MNERELVRDLVKQYAEIAGCDSQKEIARNWGRLNSLDAHARPTILLDQLPLQELNRDGELTCLCTDPALREIENRLRLILYKYRHFRGDMVLTPFFTYPKQFSNSGCGISNGISTDEADVSGASTHLFVDQLPDEASMEKLHFCKIKYDAEATEKVHDYYADLMGDILPLRAEGVMIWAALWDRLVFWRGAEKILYSFYDEPEYLHTLMKRLVAIEMDLIDQYEEQNLLQAGQGSICHCMETYVDEPKWYAIDQNHIKASDCWISGAAQIFSEVSPRMHDEFEIQYMKPLYDRFGWVNYGCCEPLDKRIDATSNILRKIAKHRHFPQHLRAPDTPNVVNPWNGKN